ncbi:PadR family transcriptional regulator [Halodesulfurarchaeum sp.]|uniref:PadR family transcriptional regulator n=1 Tax=Halodesulfurarchaeum sp. TaxID=1980530 RepID=UPI002FC2C71E
MDSEKESALSDLLDADNGGTENILAFKNSELARIGDPDTQFDMQNTEETLLGNNQYNQSNAIVSYLTKGCIHDEILKTHLDDLLLVLIATREGACGKTLRSDLFSIGYEISPGTLYPHLHALEDDGVLTMHEGVKIKEFKLSDRDEVHDRLEKRVSNLIRLSIVFNVANSCL